MKGMKQILTFLLLFLIFFSFEDKNQYEMWINTIAEKEVTKKKRGGGGQKTNTL